MRFEEGQIWKNKSYFKVESVGDTYVDFILLFDYGVFRVGDKISLNKDMIEGMYLVSGNELKLLMVRMIK